jgi:hypothetical protein
MGFPVLHEWKAATAYTYALMMKIIMYRALILARSEDMMGRKARMRENVFSCSRLIHLAFHVLQDFSWHLQ